MLAKSDTCFSGSYFKTSRYASSRYEQSPGALNWPLPPWALEQVSPVRACVCACLHVCVRACMCVCVRVCMYARVPALSTRFCAQSVWVCNPRNGSPPGSLSMGTSRQEYWSELSFPPQGNLLYQSIFCISCPGRRILCHWAPSQLRDVSWICNPVGLWTQNLLVFKPRCFGDYLRCKSQNLGVPAVFKSFIPGREALSLFPTVRVRFLMKLWPSLLYPLHCGPFLICQMHRSSSVFRAFSRGSCSICKAVNLVCLWEVFIICKWHINYSNYSLAALAPDDKI